MVLLSLHAHQGQAAWSAVKSMGSTVVTSDLSCAPTVTGQAVCAAKGVAHNFLVNRYNGTAWSGWQNLGGVITSNPSCAANGLGKVVCAATGPTGALVATIYDGSTWSAPTALAGQATSEPSCAAVNSGKVLCAVRGTAGGIGYMVYNGSAWGSYLGVSGATGKTTSGPACASDGVGNVICGALTTVNHALLAYRYNGAAWTTGLNVGGVLSWERIHCFGYELGGKFSCFGRGIDGAVWGNGFTGGAWTLANWFPWASLGSGVFSNVGCTPINPLRVICTGVGVGDSALYFIQGDGLGWTVWTKAVTTTAIRSPSCIKLAAGQALCAIVGMGNKAVSTVGP